MNERVLQKIIDQQVASDIAELDPLQTVAELLARLSERDRWVLQRRFALGDFEEEHTLEEIGQDLGVTRERVRQIESAAIDKLREDDFVSKELSSKINNVIIEFGNLMTLDKWLKLLDIDVSDGSFAKQRSAIRFLMKLDPKVKRLPKSQGFKEGWMIKGTNLQRVSKIAGSLKEIMQDQGEPVEIEELEKLFTEKEEISRKLLEGVLSSRQEFDTDLQKRWGLTKWSSVAPKRIKDKIYQVLKKVGEPIHFSTISEKINEFYPQDQVLSRTVHNELISDNRFVLVGRGIYALKEWGYEPGTVADVIENILEEAEEPLESSEIVDRVLQKRKVKANTVIANLHNKDQFKKVDRATYALNHEQSA